MKQVIALVGLPGAGKTEAVNVIERSGFTRIRFGDVTDEELRKRKLPLTEENEKVIRVRLREELGMDAYAKLNIPRIEKHEKVVIDGVRSYQEFTTLKKRFGDSVVLVAVEAPGKVRHGRLSGRKIRPLTEEECRARDRRELYQQNLEESLEKAEFRIENTGTLEELESKVNRVLGLCFGG